MKRAKRLSILFGVLVAVCIATVAVLGYQEKQEQIKTSGETILALDVDTVSALSWQTENESLTFHKSESWLYDEDEAFPVSEEKITELLSLFEDFKAAFVIEDVTDFAQYGLDAPACTIDLTAGETAYTIQLGDYSAMDSQRYVSIGDGNVYLAVSDPMDAYDIGLADTIAHDELPAFDRVESIRFDGAESYDVIYQENSDESTDTLRADDVYFRQDSDALLPLDTSLVEGYLSTVSNLALTDYVTYSATDEELAGFGLDAPELVVTVTYSPADAEDGAAETFTLSVSRDPTEQSSDPVSTSSADDPAEETITAYARVDQSPIVYQISGDSYTALMACGYNDLRHAEVLPADFADVTGFDISLDGQVYTLTSSGAGEDRMFFYGEQELEHDTLESALTALVAAEFTDLSPTEQEEIALTVYLDDQARSSVQIELYRYDGDQCLAVVDGEPFALVSRAAVVDLVEAVNSIVL